MAARSMSVSASMLQRADAPRQSSSGVRAELYGINLYIDMLPQPDEAAGNVIRILMADAHSIQEKRDCNHGLSTLSARALEAFTWPKTPQGVTRFAPQMLGPRAHDSAFKGISWTFSFAVAAATPRAVAAATTYITNALTELLQHSFFEFNATVPTTPTKLAWSGRSAVLNQRVQIDREGGEEGSKWNIRNLVNFKVMLDDNINRNLVEEFAAFVKSKKPIMTMDDANGEAKDAETQEALTRRVATTRVIARPAAAPRLMKRPASASLTTAAYTAKKRPASRD